MLRFHVRTSGAAMTREAIGSIQAGASGALLRCHASELLERGVRSLALDLSSVDAMDAGGIGALLDTRRLFEEAGATLTLLRPSERARRLLDLCCLTQVFDIAEVSSSAVGDPPPVATSSLQGARLLPVIQPPEDEDEGEIACAAGAVPTWSAPASRPSVGARSTRLSALVGV